MSQTNTIKKNRVYAPVLVALSFFVIALLLYPGYKKFIDRQVVISNVQAEVDQKTQKINKIKELQQQLASASGSESDLIKNINRYARGFNTSDIMEAAMLNQYTQGTTVSPAPIQISSINVGKGKKLPSGMSLATVSLAISAANINNVVEYLTYLTTQSPIAFTLDAVSLPVDTANLTATDARINLPVTLGVYYYE